MPDYTFINVVQMLPQDLQDLLGRFRYKAEAEQLWNLLANYIDSGSREFFVSWTDHGMRHIERIFEYVGHLISPSATNVLTPEDVFCLYTSVLLHDIAMRFDHDTVERLLTGNDPALRVLQQEWNLFCSEALHWEEDYIRAVYGDDVEVPKTFSFSALKHKSYYVVGEFLRRQHGDIAPLLVQCKFGLLYHDQAKNPFSVDPHSEFGRLLKMSSLIARSHTVELRKGIDSVAEVFGLGGTTRGTAIGVHFPYLMAVIRVADYLDFRNSSSQYFIKDTARIVSPLSQLEHATMDAFREPNWESKKMEEILVEYATVSPDIYAHVSGYIRGIQHELDVAWAVLSEYYHLSLPSLAISGLTARRIRSHNLDLVELNRKYYHDILRISVSDASIIFLLAGPLYAYDFTYALREVLSNAHDACLDIGAPIDEAIRVDLNEKAGLVRFVDAGLGMSFEDLSKYFLRVGGRLRSALDWKVRHVQRRGAFESSYAFTSRFGVGIVSLFMLGEDIQIHTHRADCEGVKLDIKQQVKELVAEKWDGPFGTQISIRLDPGIQASLSKLIRKAIEVCDGLDVGNVRSLVELMMSSFRFVPFQYDLHLKATSSKKAVSGVIPSITTLLRKTGREWCDISLRDGSKYSACIIQLSQADEFRDLTRDRLEQAVLYNGIPVTVPDFKAMKGVQSRDLLVIVDPQNGLRFNLQKTVVECLNPELVRDCYRAQFLQRLNLTADGDRSEYFASKSLEGLFRYDDLEIVRLTEALRSREHVEIYLPLVFVYESKFFCLTAEEIRQTKSKGILVVDVHASRAMDFVRRAPANIPLIVATWHTDEYTRFPPVSVIGQRAELRTDGSKGRVEANKSSIEALCRSLTEGGSTSNSLRTFLSDIAVKVKDHGIGSVHVLAVETVARMLESVRYQVRDVTWTRNI